MKPSGSASPTPFRRRWLLLLASLVVLSSSTALWALGRSSPARPGTSPQAIPAASGTPQQASGETLAQAAKDSTSRGPRPITGPTEAVRWKPLPVTGTPASGEAPLTLSDPDGQDLILEALTAKVAVHGMLSFTELEMRFKNPQARRMEGRFTAVLPSGAAISRFAKEVNGQLMEGEVVERLKAHRIYDTILHEMRDPALLEQDQGNRFSAKVFPIEANATVRLVLSYSRLLPMTEGVRTYSLPLRGLPTMERFTLQGLFQALPGEKAENLEVQKALEGPTGARQAMIQVMNLEESRYTPSQDMEIRWRPEGKAAEIQVLQAGDFFLTAFRPSIAAKAAAGSDSPWVFYLDTSASSAESQEHRITAMELLLKSLPEKQPVELWAFDQELASLYNGPAAQAAMKVGPALRERHFLGGTDLEATLTSLTARAGKAPGGTFILVSDGVATLGKTDPQALLAAVGGLPAQTRMHALVLGARQDEATLQRLVRGRGRVVSLPFVEGMENKARDAARLLSLPAGETYQLADAGAEWTFPAEVQDIRPGMEVIVLGKTKAGQGPATRLSQGSATLLQVGKAQSLPMGTFEPLLEREAFKTYLDYLAEREATETNPQVRDALAGEQVKVSVAHRVLCSKTTLLVLESEEDYRRFGLDRQGLAGILTVGPSGLERLDKRAFPITPAPTEPRPVTASSGKDKSKGEAKEATKAKKSMAPRDALAGQAADDDDEADGGGEAKADTAEEAEESEGNTGYASGMAGRAAPASRTVAAEGPRVMLQGSQSMGSSGAGRAADEARPEPAPTPSRAMAPPPPSQAPQAETARRSGGGGGGESRAAHVTAEAQPIQDVTTKAPEWIEPVQYSQADVDKVRAELKNAPRDRRLYNVLSDMLFARQDWMKLRELAQEWQAYDPENPQVYEIWGEAALNLKLQTEAWRAFASLIEVAPGKVELLQRAGLLLLRAKAGQLAEVPLRKALELRPDRANAYRHLAFVLWQLGREPEAARVLEDATKKSFPDWYKDVQRVIREELGYVYRAWAAKDPGKAGEIAEKARAYNVDLARVDALRVSLAWETDANDVDTHVVDPSGEECYYSHKVTKSGLTLYEDITQGFGPEVLRAGKLDPGVYSMGVKYFSAGPMGVSRGILIVQLGDEKGLVKQLTILPFRLVEGGRDMRLLYRLEVPGSKGKAVTK